MADKKQENLIYIESKGNISIDGIFIKAGEKAGLKKETVKKLLESRNTKKLITIKK